MTPDFTIRAAASDQVALVIQLTGWNPSAAHQDQGLQRRAQQQLADYLQRTRCRFALLLRPDNGYVVHHGDAGSNGNPLSLMAAFPTARLLEKTPPGAVAGSLLDHQVKAWLELLVADGFGALPPDEQVRAGFVPDLVNAVLGGKVVWDLVEEYQRRRHSQEPTFTGQQGQAHLQALQAEWDRTGGFDEAYMHAFLQRLRVEDRS